ncbi:MAG TPA: PD-(D/E)XK motif protein [Candidatus Angelobacter sp.]|nr:PD-(D/E)XK motif protein [Candidatus Angelobacter sp.]
MTIAETAELWTHLPPASANELSGKRVPGLPAGAPVYAALDFSNHRHLLIEVPPDSPIIDIRSTHGLNVTTEELRVRDFAGATYIDLECLQSSYHRTFTALVHDLLESLTNVPDRRKAVTACLERWRSFWLVNQAGLSREAALGLFGELWFLARWLHPITEAKLACWQGPAGARHDFQSEAASIEVKTSATSLSSSPVHFISNIDQLSDPERGKLYLFSLHVTDDVLASNTLPSVIELITTMLATDESSLALFAKNLAAAGYSPAHADYYMRPLRIIAEELYSVDAGFPRLTRNSFRSPVPEGVQDISYCLTIAACGRWRIAAGPTENSAKQVTQFLGLT